MRNHKNLLPNIILSVLFGFICFYCLLYADAVFKENEVPDVQAHKTIISEQEVYIKSNLVTSKIVLVETNDMEELLALIEYYSSQKEIAHNMAESGRALGYGEEHLVVQLAKQEWCAVSEAEEFYRKKYEELEEAFWEEKELLYPEATYIWRHLKKMGYNDYVCAGIMGNIMTEVGGQTLKLDIDADSGGHYGMCQWSKTYYPQIKNKDLRAQCKFLEDNIKYEFDTYGDNYKRNFDYSDFLELTDEREAALAFSKAYERNGPESYGARQNNAEKAYAFFCE